ncbi:MAG: hypothetical protein H5T69_18345, partial [Chloroflexi bacterium]|nr:hypothetical protein [Chloroflexota bacterium]
MMMRRRSGENGKAARPNRTSESPTRRVLRALLLALLLWVSWSATHILYRSPDHLSVQVGDVSPRNIRAPRQVTYISDLRTEDARELAAAKVADVYVGPDMEIALQQIDRLRKVCEYVEVIRLDPFATQDAKVELIREIPDLDLTTSAILKILEMDDKEWEGAVEEAARVLDNIMREEIRPNQVADARHRAQRLTTYALTADQRMAVLALVQGMIVPNTFLDAEQTAARRRSARESIQPVHATIRQGESVLREGEIVTELAYEKLQALNLLDNDINLQEAFGISLLFLVWVVMLSLYVVRAHPLLLSRPRREVLFVLTLLIIGVLSHLAVPGHTLLPYLFPAAAAVMLVAILVDAQLALAVAVVSAFMVSYNAGGSVELAMYTLAGSVVGGLAVWRMEHLGTFVRAALYMALANMAVILGFRLRIFDLDAVGLLQLMAAGVGNAVLSSSLTFVAFAFIGRVFGIATSLQLLELARPTHPLFR